MFRGLLKNQERIKAKEKPGIRLPVLSDEPDSDQVKHEDRPDARFRLGWCERAGLTPQAVMRE